MRTLLRRASGVNVPRPLSAAKQRTTISTSSFATEAAFSRRDAGVPASRTACLMSTSRPRRRGWARDGHGAVRTAVGHVDVDAE